MNQDSEETYQFICGYYTNSSINIPSIKTPTRAIGKEQNIKINKKHADNK